MFLIYIAIQQSISCETNKQILDKKNQEIEIQRDGIKAGGDRIVFLVVSMSGNVSKHILHI